ncbi:class I adenylate-forming enzyme family protein [Mycobacterium sp.]|uniref:class I adenylate-forming enzyme family protein n=1 Tax=Mycobacterium sp. TaxID=1785 RepID=UPI003D128160
MSVSARCRGGDHLATMGDIVNDNAERFPDVYAYRSNTRAVTHSQLRSRATQLVSALASAGVKRQDRVAVMARNGIEFGELLAATYLSGVALAGINVRWSQSEVSDALKRVTPRVVFCDDEFAPLVSRCSSDVSDVWDWVSIGPGRPAGMTAFEDFVAQGSSADCELVARPDDIACLLFTSGTTGSSKCCIIGQRELHRVAFAMNTELRAGSDDAGLINMPMFHFGAIAIVAGLHARGGTAVLQSTFDPAQALHLIAEQRVTSLHLAPTMLQRLLDQHGVSDALKSVHSVMYSAAPMAMASLRQALKAFPGVGFVNLYGQTEGMISGLPRELHGMDSDAAHRLASVGFPMPGVRLRIVDEDGREVPHGSAGEIVVSSDSQFRGYWDDDAATIATLRDGWCHTGDIGRLDERGLLFLVDRKKDVIVSGGENVYSPEIEDVLAQMPSVAACSVVGVADRHWGEAICAVIVARPGVRPTLDELRGFARQRLARYKVPRRVVFVDDLPVLATGKVDKKQLRTWVGQTTAGGP